MRRAGNKFGAKKTLCREQHMHDSKREALHCNTLHLFLRSGEIEALERQVKFPFEINGKLVKHDNGRKADYTADFVYTDRLSGARIVDEVKPPAKAAQGRDWPLRKAIFKALYPHLHLREV